MRFFFDTEFIEDGKTIDLISIGIVAEDGRQLYFELPDDEIPWARASDWVLENVRPHLLGGGAVCTREEGAQWITEFVLDGPEFWAYFADYDWVVLCQLYGKMIDLPRGWPMYCRDLKQLMDDFAFTRDDFGLIEGNAHHALDDARWVAQAWKTIQQRTGSSA